MSIAYLGLGSNLAEPAQQIPHAIEHLQTTAHIEMIAVSPLYQTKPVGPVPNQPDFINAAAKIATSLSPLVLLDQLLAIENRMGRRRNLDQGPRIIDLDLLLYDDVTLNHPRLQLPHPALHTRAFVIIPLLAIEAQLCLPNGQLLRHLCLETTSVVQYSE